MSSYSYYLILILIIASAILLLLKGHTLAVMLFIPTVTVTLMLCDAVCKAIRESK